MRSFIILALTLAAAAAAPPAPSSNRIIGGEITTINQYPETAALLKRFGNNFRQDCGSVIVSQRTILTAAHCVMFSTASSFRVRVSSTMHNTGGFVHNIISIILHPNFDLPTLDSDIAVLYTTTSIPNTATSRYASIAGPNYIPADNQPVWATGWGMTVPGNAVSGSYPLRHVQIWVVNQAICRERYANRITDGVPNPAVVTDNMLCSGWLDVGGRDQCQGDSGGPLYHNGVVVGICSWGESCALAEYPGVNTRVSRFANWIQQVAL